MKGLSPSPRELSCEPDFGFWAIKWEEVRADFRADFLSEALRLSAIDLDTFWVIRISLRQDLREHSDVERRAPPDDAEAAEKVEEASELPAQETSSGNVTEESIIRSGDHFHALSFLRDIDPVPSSFKNNPSELQTSRGCYVAPLEASCSFKCGGGVPLEGISIGLSELPC